MPTVIFAGATGSGKTQTFCELQKLKANANIKIKFFPEIATELLKTEPSEFCNDKDKFQTRIAQLQLAQLNDEACRKSDVIITDRGLPDFYVFHEDGAKKFFTSEFEAFSYYDYVFFFQPFALDDVLQGNALRKETSLSEIADIAQKTETVYNRYPNRETMIMIPNFPTIEEKAIYCAKMLNKVLNDTIFLI